MPETELVDHPLAYKPEAAARMIGCSRQQIYNLLARGTITSVKIGRSRRIPRAELERLVSEGAA